MAGKMKHERMHVIAIDRIIDSYAQLIRDVEWFNQYRDDSQPLDVGNYKLCHRAANEARDALLRGDQVAWQRAIDEVIRLGSMELYSDAPCPR